MVSRDGIPGSGGVYAAGVATAFHLFVVGYEEPHLRRVFGPEYDAYRQRVPRWLPAGRMLRSHRE